MRRSSAGNSARLPLSGRRMPPNVLKNGQLITVDGEMGLIYEGEARLTPLPQKRRRCLRVSAGPCPDHNGNQRESERFHPRGRRTCGRDRCRCGVGLPPDRAPDPRPQQDPRDGSLPITKKRISLRELHDGIKIVPRCVLRGNRSGSGRSMHRPTNSGT